MKVLNVDTGIKNYPIYIDNSFAMLKKAFLNSGISNTKICIITDSNVSPIYSDTIKNILCEISENVSCYAFEAGESQKNINTICDFYKFFVENHLDRKSVLVALGGGVVGDMCGFAAATYMRGIKFVQIPTTLLSQVDSSVGGKTGIDFMGNKNMVGAFYQPEFVFINTETLKTLPYREVAAGLAEAVKYGYIQDKDFLNYFIENKELLKELDSEAIANVVYGSCKVKAQVVSEDEKENGIRAILNFGHTFGHAIETLSDFKMLHGECVAVGMVAALYFSYKRGNAAIEDVEELKKLLNYFELPTYIEEFDSQSIYNQMFYDKKTKNGVINIVALNSIGNAIITNSGTKEEIKASIEYISK